MSGNHITSGGKCRNCGKGIGSYRVDPQEVVHDGEQFCSPECRREFQWGNGIL